MSDRQKILARIREALRLPAPRPGAHGGTSLDQAADASGTSVPNYAAWLPVVGPTWEERAALFGRNAADLRAEFHLLAHQSELPGAFRKLAADHGWKYIITHRGRLTDLALQGNNSLRIDHTDAGYQTADMEAADVGLTECEALVAQTGSVLVSSRSSGGRALSVLPPHHVVVASASQMVADLSGAFAHLRAKYGTDYPSFLSFITGPSRTGDIERILVLGAHGPKRLTIFCVP